MQIDIDVKTAHAATRWSTVLSDSQRLELIINGVLTLGISMSEDDEANGVRWLDKRLATDSAATVIQHVKAELELLSSIHSEQVYAAIAHAFGCDYPLIDNT